MKKKTNIIAILANINIFYILMILAGLFLVYDHVGAGIWTSLLHYIGFTKILLYSQAIIAHNNKELVYSKYLNYFAYGVQTISYLSSTIASFVLHGFNAYGMFMDLFVFALILYILTIRQKNIDDVLAVATRGG